MEIVSKGVMWADLGALTMRQAEQLITEFDQKENQRRASKEGITTIEPGENKRGNESFGGFKRKIPYCRTEPSVLSD